MLHEVALPESVFALRYRNSVYGSVAEERFEITDDGRISLRELAAEERAVLSEYYALADAPRRSLDGAELAWVGAPRDAVVVDELPLAATEHGDRTLIVDGEAPVELWRLPAAGEPTIVLSVTER